MYHTLSKKSRLSSTFSLCYNELSVKYGGKVSKLANYLNQHIVGNVFDRPSICETYATDRSVLRAVPKMVALPETAEDVCKLVRFSNQLAIRDLRLPLTIRGTGTSKTGASIGDGLVISTERMNHIEEIDTRGRLVRVQPGVTLGALNAALSLQGLCLPIDYDPHVTIGSLIANCPNDDASGKHGGIFHYVERAEVVLSSGDIVQLAPYNLRTLSNKLDASSFEGAIYRKIEQILDQHADTVLDRSTRPFDSAGYANITKVRESHTINLLPLMFASQGTLGLITDIILRIELLPPPTKRLLVAMPDLKGFLRFLNFASELDPRFLKIYDTRIVLQAAQFGNLPRAFRHHRLTEGWIAMIGFDDRRFRAAKKIQHCQNVLPPGTFSLEETTDNTDNFTEFKAVMLSFLNDHTKGERLAIADDVYIPRYRFADFVAGLKQIEEVLDLDLPVFGSYSISNYNVRPEIDYANFEGRRKVISFLRQYSQLVSDCEGSLTGGSPEGRIKALSTTQALSPAERELYLDIKAAFDPNNILNPGVKMGAELRDTIRHLCTKEKKGIITP